MCMPAFYGHVSLWNSNPTNKKDGLLESKYSPGGAPEPGKKNVNIHKRRKIKKRRQELDLKVLVLANPHSPSHPTPPQPLTEEDNLSGDFFVEQNT